MRTLVPDFTVDVLEGMPVDGRRYELIGGAIIVTPAPEPGHQILSRQVQRLLEDVCPRDHQVIQAPIDLDLPEGQRVQPDLVVVPRTSIGQKRLVMPVLLVVEVVSPGSRINDRVLKRAAYAEAGIPAYWILEPDEPLATALRLSSEGEYEVDAEGDGFSVDWPVPVAFVLSELVLRSR